MTIHNEATGNVCRHCEDGTTFLLWGFTAEYPATKPGPDSRPYSTAMSVHSLIASRHLGPAAESMSVHDICQQFNETNGGEVWLTEDGDPAPWIARRTAPNPDGSDPELWMFFCQDVTDAALWVECGQADEMVAAVP